MGFVVQGKGKVGIELRRESFYIHYDAEGTRLDDLWLRAPHPEILMVDLDELIETLQKARAELPAQCRLAPRPAPDQPREVKECRHPKCVNSSSPRIPPTTREV